MRPVLIKTAATVASTLISLAAAGLAFASSFSPLSSGVVFKDVQQSILAFAATKRILVTKY